jgi:hypothetical protein
MTTHTAAAILLISALLLLPCFWQPLIQAGDLSSHVYNAWLAGEIEAGRTAGLAIVAPWTNVLFDKLLASLIAVSGVDSGQKLAMSLLVLNFFWAAFWTVSVVAGKRPWFLVPLLAAFTYGWTFHAGFCNYLLALGLALWALGVLARGRLAVHFVAAAALALFSLAAHPLPVVWALGIASYWGVAERLEAGKRIPLLLSAMGALALLALSLRIAFSTRWAPEQLFQATGFDQLWVYGGPAYVSLFALTFVPFLAFLIEFAPGSLKALPTQIFLLTAFTIAVIPTRIDFPMYRHGLVFISDRMSLAAAVAACVLLAQIKPPRIVKAALLVLPAIFFAAIYKDAAALNRIEAKMRLALREVPRGSRVVGGLKLCTPGSRLDPLAHMVDRACAGSCFSYANYEPSTWQFRIRAVSPSPQVVTSYADAWALESGSYVVRESDTPLYQVYAAGVRTLRAGEVARRGCIVP